MIKTEIICDNCGNKIWNGSISEYFLQLKSYSAPYPEDFDGLVIDVLVKPPIENTLNFCGLGCIKNKLKDMK